MFVAAKSQLNGWHVLGGAILAALSVGAVTGAQAYLARAGSANAVPPRDAPLTDIASR